MANNYTLFSEVIPGLRGDERAWVVGLTDDPKADPPDLVAAGIAMNAIDPDDWPGFEFELTDPGGDLWIHSEECGNIVHAAQFVRAFLARFRPAVCWQMTWAEVCSKPRIGEFGGGGVFVTASSVRYCNAHDWTARQVRRFERAERLGRDRIRS
jgi:hypothetical protein